MLKLRPAKFEDAAAMLAIYAPYVSETCISFETEVPSIDEFQSRVLNTMVKFPWIVGELDGEVLGYAYASPFHKRSAYQWSVESSIYLRQGYHGKGAGRALYQKLIEILKNQGVVNVVGGMTIPNEPSRKLHEHFGFTQVAHYKDAGFKFG